MTQAIIIPTDDAHVREAYPTSNYGTDGLLRTGTDQPDWLWIARSFLKFQLPAIPGTPGTLISAKLGLYVHSKNLESLINTLEVYNCGDFSEGTVTWNTQPSMISLLASLTPGQIPQYSYLEIDVTNYIYGLGWGGIARFGLEVIPAPHTFMGPGTNIWFYSKNNGVNMPYLKLEFDDYRPAPTIVSVVPQALDPEKNTLNWVANTESDFAKYDIYRRENNGSFYLIQTITDQNIITYDDPDDLNDGSTYTYLIKTWDQYQDTDSNFASMTKPEVLDFIINNITPAISETITGTITGQGGVINSWFFDWADGTSGWVGTNTDTHAYLTSGYYQTKARVQNSGGWQSSLVNGPLVNVQSMDPVAKLGCFPKKAWVGQEVILCGEGSQDPDIITGGITNYKFDIGAGFIDMGTTKRLAVVFDTPGTKTIILEVTDTDLNTAQTTKTILVYEPDIIDLVDNLNFKPMLALDREKSLFYTMDKAFKCDGVTIHRTGSGGININIGAICDCDPGLDDITFIEGIRDNPEKTLISLEIDNKTYIGELTEIRINPMRGRPEKSWVWTATLKVDQPP